MSPPTKTHKSMVNKIFQNKYIEESDYDTEKKSPSQSKLWDEKNKPRVMVFQSEAFNLSQLRKIKAGISGKKTPENFTSISSNLLNDNCDTETKGIKRQNSMRKETKNEGVFLRKKKANHDEIKNSEISESKILYIQSGCMLTFLNLRYPEI